VAQGDLTTTSYLILGLLVSRDWSAYEIAAQVGRGVAEIWPRADRQRYNAPKRLLEKGLVTARTEATGKRERTVYSITAAGRRALTAWLATPSNPSAFEFEGMVRVILAEQGSVDDLRANLETMRDQALETRRQFLDRAENLLGAEAGSFPEREHLMALVNRFMLGHFAVIAEWADWALEQTDTWPDASSPAVSHREQLRSILETSVAPESPR
jgi:DNA-binding PadR family transcriptional regulator